MIKDVDDLDIYQYSALKSIIVRGNSYPFRCTEFSFLHNVMFTHEKCEQFSPIMNHAVSLLIP